MDQEHIVRFIDFTEEVEKLLVMEYMTGGDLGRQDPPLREGEAVLVLFQCLQALQYLHSEGLAHRDIKPENILLKRRHPFRIKLADFGLVQDASVLTTFCGTITYTAPEIYSEYRSVYGLYDMHGRRYTTAVDIWSLGLVIYGLVYGLPPFDWSRHSPTQWFPLLTERLMDWDPDGLIDILSEGMLRMNPAERLSADDCLGEVFELVSNGNEPWEHMSDAPDQPSTSEQNATPTSSANLEKAFLSTAHSMPTDKQRLVPRHLTNAEANAVPTAQLNTEEAPPSAQRDMPAKVGSLVSSQLSASNEAVLPMSETSTTWIAMRLWSFARLARARAEEGQSGGRWDERNEQDQQGEQDEEDGVASSRVRSSLQAEMSSSDVSRRSTKRARHRETRRNA